MFKLVIVTPTRLLLDEEVQRMIVRGVEGDLAIMTDTAPIVTPTKISVLRLVMADGSERKAAIGCGYVTVRDNKATLVVETAEWAREINITRAEAAKRRAEERLAMPKSDSGDTDYVKARLALNRALARINAANDRY